MTTRSPERETFLAEIGTTAAEGGINYWCHVENYQWFLPDIEGGELCPGPNGGGNVSYDITPVDELIDDFTRKHIDLDVVARGWRRLLSDHVDGKMKTLLNECDRANDDVHSIIDALIADEVIQLGVLGELLYG